MTGMFPGSTFKNQHEVAKGLSLERDEAGNPLYDVTILVAKGQKKVKETETLHIHEFPIPVEDIVLNGQDKTVFDKLNVAKEINLQMITLLNENRFVMDELKAKEFDIALIMFFPIEVLLCRYLEIPFLTHIFFLSDPFISTIGNLPS